MVDPLTTLSTVVGGQLWRQMGTAFKDLVVARAHRRTMAEVLERLPDGCEVVELRADGSGWAVRVSRADSDRS